MTPGTTTTGSLLNPASGTHTDSPSLSGGFVFFFLFLSDFTSICNPLGYDRPSQAALAGGSMVRPWSQVARKWADAEKAAAASVVAARGGSAEGSVGRGGGGGEGGSQCGQGGSERGSHSGQGGKRTLGRGLEVAWPRYVGSDAKSAYPSPLTPDHSQYPGALVIHYTKELADEPWNDEADDCYSSPPPPIPFLVDIEIKAKFAQLNEDVKLWLRKV